MRAGAERLEVRPSIACFGDAARWRRKRYRPVPLRNTGSASFFHENFVLCGALNCVIYNGVVKCCVMSLSYRSLGVSAGLIHQVNHVRVLLSCSPVTPRD
jgi:hypothetical protein